MKTTTTRKLESAAPKAGSGNRFAVTMLQEGLGNFANAFYYSKEAILSAVPVFEGKKAYYNHPSASEEQDRPERDVREILGHFENVKAVEVSGRMELQGELVVPPGEQFDGARALVQHALEYAKKFPTQDFVGLSINASGDAEEVELAEVMKTAPAACMEKLQKAKDEYGIETVRLTKVITDADSCDLVTEAGAGGKILKMLERAKERKTMKVKKQKALENANPAADQDAHADVHADQDQDVALIKSMLDKHMGDGQHDEADAAMMQKALKAANKMGLQGEEAEKAAAHHVQMSKHIAQSEAEGAQDGDADDAQAPAAPAQKKPMPKKPAAPAADAPAEESEAESESEAHEAEAESEESESESEAEAEAHKKEKGKKEAASKSEVIRLKAENAALKERLAKIDLEKHIEKKLSESGLPRSATKVLKESIGEVKTAAEFDKALKLFTEARKSALGGEAEDGFEDVFANPEKHVAGDDAGEGISFADAAE